MMKPEEAIEILELPKEPLKSGTHYHAIPSPKRISYTDYLNARKAAVEALEKQVPKKPVIAESAPSYVLGKKVYTEYKACGVCGDVVGGGCAEKSNYCSECGNKVDWSEEE